jgi:hypothetical protein
MSWKNRPKKQPVGWMGAVPAPQRGKWLVVDSTGSRIAGLGGGFETRALARRWIDGYCLEQAGYRLAPDDHKEIRRQQHCLHRPGLQSPTESDRVLGVRTERRMNRRRRAA